MGHVTDVLMLSRLRVGVRGCGELDRVCPTVIGRGRAIVAILYCMSWAYQANSNTGGMFNVYEEAACTEVQIVWLVSIVSRRSNSSKNATKCG